MRPPRLPTPVALIVLVLSLAITISASMGFVMALAPARRLFIGFEGVLLVAGVFGVLTALHRFRAGPALAVLCVGGSVLVCGVLAEPLLVPKLMGQQVVPPVLWGINLITIALARVAIGLILVGIAAATVLVRRPAASTRYIMLAAALALPLVVAAALSRVPSVMGSFKTLPPPVIAIVVAMAFFIFGACFAVSAHCAIRAFEVARDADGPEPGPSPT